MIGARRSTPEHKRSGLQAGKGQGPSQDGHGPADWQSVDDWPLALLFPEGKLADWGGTSGAFPAEILRGLAINDLAANDAVPDIGRADTTHPDPGDMADDAEAALGRPILFRGMQFLLRLRTARQTESRHAGSHRLLIDQDIQGLTSLELCAGPHIVAVRNSAPVMAAMLELAGMLIDRIGASIIGWGPADQIMPGSYFVRTATPFIHGGPWPLLALVHMHQRKPDTWQTIGLDWLFGQNIMLEVPSGFDRLQALDRLFALARDIADHGPISEQGCIPGKAVGEQLTIGLQPRSDGRRDVAARLLIG